MARRGRYQITNSLTPAPPQILRQRQQFNALLADKAFDVNWLLEDLHERGAGAVIRPKANRKHLRDYDREVYKWRHLVENYFVKIKEFRGVATRYVKTDNSYAAYWNLVAALVASK